MVRFYQNGYPVSKITTRDNPIVQQFFRCSTWHNSYDLNDLHVLVNKDKSIPLYIQPAIILKHPVVNRSLSFYLQMYHTHQPCYRPVPMVCPHLPHRLTISCRPTRHPSLTLATSALTLSMPCLVVAPRSTACTTCCPLTAPTTQPQPDTPRLTTSPMGTWILTSRRRCMRRRFMIESHTTRSSQWERGEDGGPRILMLPYRQRGDGKVGPVLVDLFMFLQGVNGK